MDYSIHSFKLYKLKAENEKLSCFTILKSKEQLVVNQITINISKAGYMVETSDNNGKCQTIVAFKYFIVFISYKIY